MYNSAVYLNIYICQHQREHQTKQIQKCTLLLCTLHYNQKRLQQASFLFCDKERNHLGFQKHMQGRRTKTLTTFLLRWWHENWMISAIIYSSKWNVFNYRCLNLGNKAERKKTIYIYSVFIEAKISNFKAFQGFTTLLDSVNVNILHHSWNWKRRICSVKMVSFTKIE